MNALTKVLLALACACCVALCIEGMAPKPACALEPMSLSDEMKYFAKYESSQNYAQTFSSGDDYNAMGYYQFDRRYGLRDFMQTCYDDHPHIFKALGKALEYSSGDFKNKDVVYTDDDGYVHFTSFGVTLNAAWKAAHKSDPELFAGYQDAWAYQQYYRPVQRIMKSRYGIDLSERSDCIKGLCWGMCNLFGQTGCLYFFDKAGLSAGMSDRQFARAACNAVVDNVAARYPSQPQYHQGWQNRYKKELTDCLGYLGQWIHKAGGWTFVVKGEPLTSEWEEIDGSWYYFDKDGYAVQDTWKKIGGSWYLFDDGCHMLTGWQKPERAWYYLDSSGAMVQGWRKIRYDGTMSWFYFRTGNSGGQMLTGWRTIPYDGSDRDFYFTDDGVMLTGWQKIGGSWYAFSGSGVAYAGWEKLDYGGTASWFLFGDDHRMRTGWQDADGERYYLAGSGRMLTGWQKIDGSYYLLEGSGALVRGWYFGGVNTYYLGADGAMATGWQRIDGSWYLFDDDGHRLTGWQKPYVNWYRFDDDGKMLTGWQKIEHDGSMRWFYFMPGDEGGRMLTGWQKIVYDGKERTFYFDKSGAMLTGTQVIDGVTYTFASSGVLQEPDSANAAPHALRTDMQDDADDASGAQVNAADATEAAEMEEMGDATGDQGAAIDSDVETASVGPAGPDGSTAVRDEAAASLSDAQPAA
ncbi:N-acetylmuramoyl-L-alanine amidase family protein [Slackia exigua]|uniref:Cell wall-binding repeat protein n=1 Tax=Slackia exigua (strain ATCC 700122 / DSM 15923 / CIP 105133 / JCM 11022 / KCTC 5966 / S-7) TaxID=649764 RepID=D0WIR5_SLAES|nr:cell wall-binding protein [Slackia exigua]EEZ60616.1 cell wall-binding repeat protein [Slackia exigua ATCC 700122]STN99894.1 Toxin A [Slackia exigua]